MLPVAVKVPVRGLYNSALVRPYVSESFEPAAINTLPSVSRVAVCPKRAVVILPVAVNVPGDCAINIAVWLAAPRNRSESTELDFMSRLQDSETVERPVPDMKKLCC